MNMPFQELIALLAEAVIDDLLLEQAGGLSPSSLDNTKSTSDVQNFMESSL
jgi:hypothetical protein